MRLNPPPIFVRSRTIANMASLSSRPSASTSRWSDLDPIPVEVIYKEDNRTVSFGPQELTTKKIAKVFGLIADTTIFRLCPLIIQ